jgi:hypothetical protein
MIETVTIVNGDRHRHRIRRLDAEEHLGDLLRELDGERYATRHANDDADEARASTTRGEPSAARRTLRAERHADADLVRAARDAVGHQAEETNAGEHQRERPDSV